ncbi:hypothetical protein SDC9_183699 [bioreactor metagenome]|uniref:Uncharacterized protein n=1 Tax=bioreactor metagenome TaxID=1076179 RepID=A0A645HAX5_9ZZZZ
MQKKSMRDGATKKSGVCRSNFSRSRPMRPAAPNLPSNLPSHAFLSVKSRCLTKRSDLMKSMKCFTASLLRAESQSCVTSPTSRVALRCRVRFSSPRKNSLVIAEKPSVYLNFQTGAALYVPLKFWRTKTYPNGPS